MRGKAPLANKSLKAFPPSDNIKPPKLPDAIKRPAKQAPPTCKPVKQGQAGFCASSLD